HGAHPAAQGGAGGTAGQGAGRRRSGDARGALGLDRAAEKRRLLRGRRRRVAGEGRRGAHLGVTGSSVGQPPILWARTDTVTSPIGSIRATMASPGLSGLTPSGVPV